MDDNRFYKRVLLGAKPSACQRVEEPSVLVAVGNEQYRISEIDWRALPVWYRGASAGLTVIRLA